MLSFEETDSIDTPFWFGLPGFSGMGIGAWNKDGKWYLAMVQANTSTYLYDARVSVLMPREFDEVEATVFIDMCNDWLAKNSGGEPPADWQDVARQFLEFFHTHTVDKDAGKVVSK